MGELVEDGAQPKGKCAKPMPIVNAPAARRFCAGDIAGGPRQLPARKRCFLGCLQREKGEGVHKGNEATLCVGSRRT